jgi:hypothetical protein
MVRIAKIESVANSGTFLIGGTYHKVYVGVLWEYTPI